jgi:hypothetical protein
MPHRPRPGSGSQIGEAQFGVLANDGFKFFLGHATCGCSHAHAGLRAAHGRDIARSAFQGAGAVMALCAAAGRIRRVGLMTNAGSLSRVRSRRLVEAHTRPSCVNSKSRNQIRGSAS